jgi:rhamnogalacturonan endolyase
LSITVAATLSVFFQGAQAILNATETTTQYIIANDRLYAAVNKTTGSVQNLLLDGQDLLGPNSGAVGQGPYLDCSCKSYRTFQRDKTYNVF